MGRLSNRRPAPKTRAWRQRPWLPPGQGATEAKTHAEGSGMMRDDTPVIIGAGQFTYRGPAASSPPPLDLLKIAADRAAANPGLAESALAQLDGVAVVGFTIDAPGALSQLPFPRLKNPPATLARGGGAPPPLTASTPQG